MPITRSLPLCRRTFVTDLAFNLIMDCGQAMLANGGEVFRAQDTMEIMARSFGIVDFHVYVLTNGIFASAQNGTVSAVRHVPAVSTNLGHVEAINAISRRVADGELDLNSAQLEFERMKRMPTLSPLYSCAAGTMGAGCFAMLFGGGLPEMLVGALGGLLASASSCALSKHHISRRLFSSSVPVPKVLRMPGTPGRWCSANAAGTYRTSSTSALGAWVMRRRV